MTEHDSDKDVLPTPRVRQPILKTPNMTSISTPLDRQAALSEVPGQGRRTAAGVTQQSSPDNSEDQRFRHEPGSSGLPLPKIPEIMPRKNTYLPGPALAYTLKACKGTSVYKRLRTLVWDFHSDLEDANKKREAYWTILIERLDSMLVDMRQTLDDREFKESFPLYTKALGNEKEGLAAWTILTQNQLAGMSDWTDQAGVQAWEAGYVIPNMIRLKAGTFLQIIRSSTEMLNQRTTPLSENTSRGFVSLNQGFKAMLAYFVTLERELQE